MNVKLYADITNLFFLLHGHAQAGHKLESFLWGRQKQIWKFRS